MHSLILHETLHLFLSSPFSCCQIKPRTQSRPSSQLPDDGNWVHDKFAEVNDIPKAGGALAARISGGTSSTGGAKLLAKALGSTGGTARPNAGGRVASGGSLSIKGASVPVSSTLEIRELVAGTTPEDVKVQRS